MQSAAPSPVAPSPSVAHPTQPSSTTPTTPQQHTTKDVLDALQRAKATVNGLAVLGVEGALDGVIELVKKTEVSQTPLLATEHWLTLLVLGL